MKKKLRILKSSLLFFSLSFSISQSQTISTIAGNLQGGYAGDGGGATVSELNSPSAVAVDTAGNIYIADSQNNVIRKITKSSGIITTVAGNGTGAFAGDGGLATVASLFGPSGVAVDKAGNIYISDQNNYRIRKVTKSTGLISTIAGNGSGGLTGDGGLATSAQVNSPAGICLDTAGNLYIADNGNYVIRKITKSTGNINTVAGTGTTGYSGDNGAATFAQLGGPYGVAVDAAKNIYIADSQNNVIRKVNSSTGIISTIAGIKGNFGFTGDGGLATSAPVGFPISVVVDAAGNIFISDNSNSVIRKINTLNGNISTVAGIGGKRGYFGDAGLATSAMLNAPSAICLDASGNILIGDNGNSRIRMVTTSTGMISTIAGNLQGGYAGDGGGATVSELNSPSAVAVDTAGNIYIADSQNNVIRKITKSSGIITTVAGNGTGAFAGDGGLATVASLFGPSGVAVDKAGNIYISDQNNYRIRKVTKSTGLISTIAGNGSGGLTGDGGLATSAQVNSPAGICLDTAGNLYIADNGNYAIRKITKSTGNINTVAGTGTTGYSGDNGAATFAQLGGPYGVAVDAAKNIYIADSQNNVIRKVNSSTGIISTIAGIKGNFGFTGDGGLATSAPVGFPISVVVDAAGNIFISDNSNSVIRAIDASTGKIYSVAGVGGDRGYFGDGGPATSAYLNTPNGICIDKSSVLTIADNGNNRVRQTQVDLAAIINAGIKPIDKIDLSLTIYPNPNAGCFILDLGNLPREKINIDVINALGQIVYSVQTIPNGKYNVDMGHIVKGLYIVNVYNSKNTYRSRIVVE